MRRIAIAGVLALVAGQAKGDGVIHQFNASRVEIGSGTPYSGTAQMDVHLDTNTRCVDIIPSSDSDDTPYLTFKDGPASTETVRFFIGHDSLVSEPDFDDTDSLPSKGGHNISGINASENLAATTVLYGGIKGDFGVQCTGYRCNGTAYTLKFDRLVRFDIGGTMYGDMTIEGISGWTPCVVEAGAMSAESSILLKNGSITRIKTVGGAELSGDMKASIVVEGNSIASGHTADLDLIDAAGRITGFGGLPTIVKKGRIKKVIAGTEISQFQDPDFPVNNTIAMMRANEGIDWIQAPFIDGYISANSNTFDAVSDGAIRKVITTSASRGVDAHARINASKVVKVAADDLIDIKGDLDGDIVVDGDMNGTIRIGHSLTSAGSITMGAGGLVGQIIINGDVSGGTWANNTITVGGTTLTASYYSNSETSLGGGAVGLAPYHLHAADCAPAHDDTWGSDIPPTSNPLLNSLFSQGTQSVRMRFYGPVYTNATGGLDGEGVTLWYWITRSQQWQDVTDAATVTLPRSAGAAWSRDITLTGNGAHLPPGFYAVVARTDSADSLRLICNGTTGATPPSPGANMGALVQYNFRLWADCDNTGEIDSGVLGARTFCHGDGCAADVDDGSGLGNPDGGVDINDLLFYLSIYEGGFPGADVDDGSGTGTPDEGVDINDLLFFLDRYEAGC